MKLIIEVFVSHIDRVHLLVIFCFGPACLYQKRILKVFRVNQFHLLVIQLIVRGQVYLVECCIVFIIVRTFIFFILLLIIKTKSILKILALIIVLSLEVLLILEIMNLIVVKLVKVHLPFFNFKFFSFMI